MLNNLTTKFQEALMQAQQTAGRLGKPEISSLDVLVALRNAFPYSPEGLL